MPSSALGSGDKAVGMKDIILALMELPVLWGTHKNAGCAFWGDQDAGRAPMGAPNPDLGVQGRLPKGSDG